MKYDNTRNILNGMKYGIVYKIMMLLLPFALRTVMIYALGMEYVGINSLFTSILSTLSLAELGFSGAVVFHMYQPIAHEDHTKLCALLKYYRRVYKSVGLIIFCLGLLVLPFLKYLITSALPPDLHLYVLFLGFLINTCSSYFFGGYRTSVLTAHQREDIVSQNNGVIMLIGYMTQIAGLLVFKNYYLYLLNVILITVTTNMVRAVNARKLYPHIQCKGKLSKEDRKEIQVNVGALFLQKVGGTVSLSFDTMVISAFLGITMVALYGNYYLISTSILSFFMLFFNLITAGIGNSMVLESPQRNYEYFKKYAFLADWALIWATSSLVCLYQPFMSLWVGQGGMLDFPIVMLISVLFYLTGSRRLVLSYKDAAGLWKKNAFSPLIAAAVNLALNLLLVRGIGIYGIVLSTIISYVMIEIPWDGYVLFRHYFAMRPYTYYAKWCLSLVKMAVVAAATYGVCAAIDVSNLAALIAVRLILCIVVPNVLLLLISWRNPNREWANSFIYGKLFKREPKRPNS
jgi:O-antigen/teichoic acid export membrane protein